MKRSYTKPFLKMGSGGMGTDIELSDQHIIMPGGDAALTAVETVTEAVEAADAVVTVEEAIVEEVVVPAVDYVAMWAEFSSQYNVGGLVYGDSSTYPAGFAADNPDTWITAVITE